MLPSAASGKSATGTTRAGISPIAASASSTMAPMTPKIACDAFHGFVRMSDTERGQMNRYIAGTSVSWLCTNAPTSARKRSHAPTGRSPRTNPSANRPSARRRAIPIPVSAASPRSCAIVKSAYVGFPSHGTADRAPTATSHRSGRRALCATSCSATDGSMNQSKKLSRCAMSQYP